MRVLIDFYLGMSCQTQTCCLKLYFQINHLEWRVNYFLLLYLILC
jgi:hypothetical protein